MSTLKYTLSSYRSYLNYSHDRHLLVEGRDDKRVFELFLDELFEQTSYPEIRRVCIDTAENLIEFEKAGNREKVEAVCESVSEMPYSDMIVGFVDREFRRFDYEPHLTDSIEGHLISNRLIWSRGHSIENYYFDFELLRQPLRLFSVTDRFSEALDLFESVFEKAIRLACIISLASYEVEMLDPARGSIGREIFRIKQEGDITLELDLDTWQFILTEQIRLTTGMTDRLIERFLSWAEHIEKTDFEVVRWICHGHIGIAVIWAVYSCCVGWICRQQDCEEDAEREARRVLKADESVRFNACAEYWVQKSLGNHCLYPQKVFDLLGLDILQP
jgi:hypothetical protein